MTYSLPPACSFTSFGPAEHPPFPSQANLKMKYPSAFSCPNIREIHSVNDLPHSFKSCSIDVNMGECELTEDETISTTGCGPCLALCARCINSKGKIILGIHHICPPAAKDEAFFEKCFEDIEEDFEDSDCDPEDIEYFILGGCKYQIDTAEFLLSLTEKPTECYDSVVAYNIKAAHLCVSDTTRRFEEGIDVYMDRENIYFLKA
jgi:hypothetical protein